MRSRVRGEVGWVCRGRGRAGSGERGREIGCCRIGGWVDGVGAVSMERD